MGIARSAAARHAAAYVCESRQGGAFLRRFVITFIAAFLTFGIVGATKGHVVVRNTGHGDSYFAICWPDTCATFLP